MLAIAARGSGPGCAAFDRLRALRSSELQGRDEEQGFSGPNKEQAKGGSGKDSAHIPTSRRMERAKERGLARRSKGLPFEQSGKRYGQWRIVMFDWVTLARP